jgi:hypothetical protein
MRIRNVLIGVIAGAAILYLMYLIRFPLERFIVAIPAIIILYVAFKLAFRVSSRIGESTLNIGDRYINDKIQSAIGNRPPRPIKQIIQDSITEDFEGIRNIQKQTEILKDQIAGKYDRNGANTNQDLVDTPDRAITLSVADELRKLKELVGEGILTEDEFNAKKKQLLGI